MNKALQNLFFFTLYLFFFLPGSPQSFALFLHLPICCLIWHQLLLMSLLSYCFLYRSLASTRHNCFFPSSHALPCEKTQGTVCAPLQTPCVRFNKWPPHEGHILLSVLSHTCQFTEEEEGGLMVKYVKLHFKQCRWIQRPEHCFECSVTTSLSCQSGRLFARKITAIIVSDVSVVNRTKHSTKLGCAVSEAKPITCRDSILFHIWNFAWFVLKIVRDLALHEKTCKFYWYDEWNVPKILWI